MTRLTDEEIDLELKSDSWTIKKRMASELKENRVLLSESKDVLVIAIAALLNVSKHGSESGKNWAAEIATTALEEMGLK